MKVEIVGGPADGRNIDRPSRPTVQVATITGGRFIYTLRRCRNAAGDVVEVLAPAGRPIDPKWLATNNLTN
jgi:hypothetical protein